MKLGELRLCGPATTTALQRLLSFGPVILLAAIGQKRSFDTLGRRSAEDSINRLTDAICKLN